MNQASDDVSETLSQGFNEQFVLAREVFVKPSMSQAGVAHDRGNGCPIQTLGADAPRGVFHDLLVSLDFVFGTITHDK
jgi:hypothetical protein